MIETKRLTIEFTTKKDAPEVQKLFNQPACLKYIGDKNIHDLVAAERYIENNFIASYLQNDFGLYRVELKESKQFIGLCGLVKRDGIDTPDLGFALLSEYEGKGYAEEACLAVIEHCQENLPFKHLYAFTDPENMRSRHLLEKLNFQSAKRESVPEFYKNSFVYQLSL